MSFSATENEDGRASSIEVVMPQMGVSVAEGTIAGWLKRPGETVAADEAICEVSTDKIDVEIPAPGAGRLEEVLAAEGETVSVGTVIARIATGPAPGSAANGDEADDRVPHEIDRSGFYSPVVRRIAADRGVELDAVDGHGIGGRVRKVDLLAHIEGASGTGNGSSRPLHSESPYRPEGPRPSATEAPGRADAAELTGPTHSEAMDPMRRAIAEHMVTSRRTAAHCTTIIEADFSSVAGDRGARMVALRDRGVPLTYLAYVARAVVGALERHPVLNASVIGGDIVYHEDVNLGIAVALEEGLLVPVIRKAQRLSLEGLAAAIADLAGRARAGGLEPDELAGGTFTITNPGQFGTLMATPIINQPEVGILDLEAITRRPVVVADDHDNEAIAIRPMSYLCLSWDHRALDGLEAARFLATVRGRIESEVQG